MGKRINMIGDGASHHVKLGKHTNVKAGPTYKNPGKAKHAKDMYKNSKAESQT